jgi:hypothetical protein
MRFPISTPGRLVLVAPLALASCGRPPGGGGGGGAPGVDDPAVVEAWETFKRGAFGELRMAGAWESPELLRGEVNTIGWEDSAYIDAGHDALWFYYLPGDLFRVEEMFKFHRPKAQGGHGEDPKLYSRYHKGPIRGVTPLYTSDAFSARREGKEFLDVTRFKYSRDGRNEWGLMEDPEGTWYYVSHVPSEQPMNRDLYRNEERLEIPGRARYQEDNPHFIVTEYGRELFFDSADRSGTGKAGLYVTREVDGAWTEPEPLAAPANSGKTEVQPFLTDDGVLYFSSARDGVVAIYSCRRKGRNEWGPARRVLWPSNRKKPRLWGVGEPTLTRNGRWLYFVAVFENKRSRFDCDIARVRLKK